MKEIFQRIFINNWQRKILSLILAVIVWFVVNQSLTKTKTLSNVGVRIVHLPEGLTIDGMFSNRLLNRRVDLTITGNRLQINKIQPSDVEVMVDASEHGEEWIEKITKKNVIAADPNANTNLAGIKRVLPVTLALKPKKLIREKIPVIITEPKGDSPKGYQFVDVWPYRAHVALRGPEDIIKRYKARGVKLTFNLSDISHSDLDRLKLNPHNGHEDVISYDIPNHWKQIYLPELSSAPIDIDNKKEQHLHVDFVRTELLPVKAPIQIGLYYPLRSGQILKSGKLLVADSPLVKNISGIKVIKEELYTRGVSELFLQVVRNMLEITVIAGASHNKNSFEWSVQFINPRELEDRYVTMVMGDSMSGKSKFTSPKMREEYLRNRFRSYMNRFQLYRADGSRFELDIIRNNNTLTISETDTCECCPD